MSLASEHAERCKRELDEKRMELNSLIELRAELKQKFQDHGTEVVQADIDGINREIDTKRAEIVESGQELQEAVATLTAENKLEAELHQQLNKDNDPELGKDVSKNLDNFGKKKDDDMEL